MSYYISFYAASVKDAIEHLESDAHKYAPTVILEKLKTGLNNITHEVHGVHVEASGHLANGKDHTASNGTYKIQPITFVKPEAEKES